MTAIGDYALTVELDVPYEDARERVEVALKEQGFGIVTELDMKRTFKAKLDREFRKYAILGACNPNLAIRALTTEPLVGLLLPCNVIVYEDESGTGSIVAVIDPAVMLGDVDVPGLDDIASEAHDRLSRVVEALAT